MLCVCVCVCVGGGGGGEGVINALLQSTNFTLGPDITLNTEIYLKPKVTLQLYSLYLYAFLTFAEWKLKTVLMMIKNNNAQLLSPFGQTGYQKGLSQNRRRQNQKLRF